MLIINFDKNELCKKAYGLWQYDYGQVLRIQGLNLPTAAEIHFALQETGGEAVTRIGITKDGVTDVTIPDSLLEADGASQDYQIYVFIYLASPESGETTRRITLGVKSRPRPEAFNTPGEGELFEKAIQAVNDAAKRAEDAGKEATAAAGEARESASLAGKYLADTKALVEQVEINADAVAQGKEEAARLLAQTQEAASNAALSAGAAKQSETAAREAQTAAETAEDAARQYAAETEADRQEVAESKQSVTQMQSDVANMQADVQADKEAVEQTVSEFGTAAQNALTAIGQAQNTAVSAVQAEGRKQATAVRETGTQAVSEVETAKTAAVEAVTAEGDVQVGRVEDAAAEIVADREQIQKIKTDIAALTDKTNTLAPGIVLDAKGGAIAVHNASEQPFVGLNVYGKSTQVKTTGAQLFDASKIPTSTIGGATIVNNGDGSFSIEGSGKLTEQFSVQYDYSHEETIKLLKPGTITLLTSKNTYPYLRISIGKDLYIHNKYNSPVTSANITEELLTNENTTLQIRVFGSSGDSIVGGTFTPTLYQEGDGTWEPYTGGKPSPSLEYPQDIVNAGDAGEINVRVCGKNFFDVSKVEDTFNGTYGLINNNGILTVTSSEKDSTVTTNKTLRELCPELVEGRQYVLYANSTGNAKKIYLSGAAKEAWEFGKTKTITKTHLESLVRFYADTNVATTAVIKDIQIELGSTATDYEPYKPAQSLTLATPNGLAGIPVKSGGNYVDENGQQWVADEIDLNRGIKLQRVIKMTFDGSENWKPYSPEHKGFYLKSNFPNDMEYREGFCNTFRVMKNSSDYVLSNSIRLGAHNNMIYCVKTSYYDDSLPDKGLANWKACLNDNPLEVITYVSQPIRTPLSPEEITAYKALHTYSPNTTVTNDAGCGMAVEYVADTKTYIKAVEDKITAIQAALINQNISGGGITVDDATELPISSLQIFGRSEQVKTTGAQLYPEVAFTSSNKGYATMSGLNNGIITIIGTNITKGGRNTIKTPSFLLSPGTYTASFSGRKECELFLVNEANNTNIVTDTQNNFELPEETSVHFGINGVSGKNYNDEFRIMLNSGDASLPYEPYTGGKPSPSPEYPQEITSAGDKGTLEVKIADSGAESQRLILSTPNGLPGIPVKSGGNYVDENGQQWICDEIDLARGVSIQRIEKHIFGNNDSFIINTALSEKLNRFSWREYQSKAKKETPIMCDIFKFSGFSELKQENSMYGAKNFSRCFIYVDKNIDSEEKFKALINGKKSFYVLETPIITPLSPKEIAAYKSLHTYSGTTVVANDSGAGMSLTYTVDTKKYVDKKIAAISAAMIGG